MKTTLLIFGATGDLAQRKLLPALDELKKNQQIDTLRIVGISRRDISIEEIFAQQPELQSMASVFTMNMEEKSEYLRLRTFLALEDDEQLLVYLSVPPRASTQIVDFLGEAGVSDHRVKILFEKPFGFDLTSAKEMISRTARFFDEQQLYRIDHYLAKEMAQNIVAFRGRNALFGHIWHNGAIEKIEVIASEKLDIEGRAGFYEQTGALKDLVQGHLLQLLALTTMEIPHDFDWDALPALRYAALKKILPAKPDKAFRAQYDGYRNEVENPKTMTETFVALELSSEDEKLAGVPLHIITGKALAQKTTEIRIHLKKMHEAQSNCITFRIQPNEGIEIEIFAKIPGYTREFSSEKMNFEYAKNQRVPDAYEQVLLDAIASKKSLFTTGEEVIRSWEILQPMLQAWAMDESVLGTYQKGTPFDQVVVQ